MPAGGTELAIVSISAASSPRPALPGHVSYSQHPVPKQEVSAADVKTELAVRHDLPDSAYILPGSFHVARKARFSC